VSLEQQTYEGGYSQCRSCRCQIRASDLVDGQCRDRVWCQRIAPTVPHPFTPGTQDSVFGGKNCATCGGSAGLELHAPDFGKHYPI
jgi:hypothetical protein